MKGEITMTKTGTVQSRKRQAQVEAGMFDGRFKTKIIQDKKKKVAKIACRKFKQTKIED